MQFLKRLISLTLGVYLCMQGLSLQYEAPSAYASVVLRLSERDLVRRSLLVVLGRVHSSQSLRSHSTGHIVTDFVIRVQRFIKGKTVTPWVMVRCMGGTIGTVHAHVSGESRLRVGQQILLHLTTPKPNKEQKKKGMHYFYITNMAYGALHVLHNPHTQRLEVYRQDDLPSRIHKMNQRVWTVKHRHQTRSAIPLKEVIQRIQRDIVWLRRYAAHTPLVQKSLGVNRGQSVRSVKGKVQRIQPRRPSKRSQAQVHPVQELQQ